MSQNRYFLLWRVGNPEVLRNLHSTLLHLALTLFLRIRGGFNASLSRNKIITNKIYHILISFYLVCSVHVFYTNVNRQFCDMPHYNKVELGHQLKKCTNAFCLIL